MKIPQWKRQVDLKEQSPTRAPAAAFGADIGEAKVKQAEAIGTIVNKVSDHIIAWKKADTQAKTLSEDTSFRMELQDMLINKDTGFLNAEGRNANGITVKFQEEAMKARAKYKLLPDHMAESAMVHPIGTISSHEATQIRKSQIADVESNIRVLADSLPTLSNADAEKEIGRMVSIMDTAADLHGMTEAQKTVKRDEMITQSLVNLIRAKDGKDYIGTKALVDKMIPNIGAQNQGVIKNAMDGAETLNAQKTGWEIAQTIPDVGDGVADVEGMLNAVKNNLGDKVTPEKLEKVNQYIKAMASEKNRLIEIKHNSDDFDFITKVYEAKNNKTPYSADILKIDADTIRNPLHAAQRQETANKIYNSPMSEDRQKYMMLYRGIHSNEVNQKMVDKAQGDITLDHYYELSKMIFDKTQTGKNDVNKAIWDTIEAKYKNVFSNKRDYANMMYELKEQSAGLTNEQLVSLADKELEKVKGTGWLRNKKKIEMDFKSRDFSNKFWAEIQNEFGVDSLVQGSTTYEIIKYLNDNDQSVSVSNIHAEMKHRGIK